MARDPLERVVRAFADLERHSNASFPARYLIPLYRERLTEALLENDRADLIAPITLDQYGPGVAVFFADRAVFIWQQGTFRIKTFAATIPYSTVTGVTEAESKAGRLSVAAEQQWIISIHPKAPDPSFWYGKVMRRLTGEWLPLWEGDAVTRWTSPELAAAEAVENEGGGRWLDLAALGEDRDQSEQVRAGTGGGLLLGLKADYEGNLILTDRRVVMISRLADPTVVASRPLSEVTGVEAARLTGLLARERHDLPDAVIVHFLGQGVGNAWSEDLDVISIGFEDGPQWSCISDARSRLERETFVGTLRASTVPS